MIIDCHAHIPRLPGTKFAKMNFEQVLRVMLKEMKAGRVDHAILLPSPKNLRSLPGLDGPSAPTLREQLKLCVGVKNIHHLGTIEVMNHKKRAY